MPHMLPIIQTQTFSRNNQLIDNWEEAFAKMRISAQNLIEPKSERGDAAAKFHS